jgi:hypothetical protein
LQLAQQSSLIQVIEWDHSVHILRDGLRTGNVVFVPLAALLTNLDQAAAAADLGGDGGGKPSLLAAAELQGPSGPRTVRAEALSQASILAKN